jgi:hypothetical protein
MTPQLSGQAYDCTVDIGKLADMIEAFGDKTVAEAVDGAYGEGAMDAIIDMISAVPAMTLRQVANTVIVASETYGIDAETAFAWINYFIYDAYGVEVDIQKEIINRYDVQLANIVAELSGIAPSPQYVAAMSAQLAAYAEVVAECDINELYNLIAFGNPDYTDSDFVTGKLYGMIKNFSDYTETTFVLTDEGKITNITFTAYEGERAFPKERMTFRVLLSHIGRRSEFYTMFGDYSVNLTVMNGEGASFIVYKDDETFLSASVTCVDGETVISCDAPNGMSLDAAISDEEKTLSVMNGTEPVFEFSAYYNGGTLYSAKAELFAFEGCEHTGEIEYTYDLESQYALTACVNGYSVSLGVDTDTMDVSATAFKGTTEYFTLTGNINPQFEISGTAYGGYTYQILRQQDEVTAYVKNGDTDYFTLAGNIDPYFTFGGIVYGGFEYQIFRDSEGVNLVVSEDGNMIFNVSVLDTEEAETVGFIYNRGGTIFGASYVVDYVNGTVSFAVRKNMYLGTLIYNIAENSLEIEVTENEEQVFYVKLAKEDGVWSVLAIPDEESLAYSVEVYNDNGAPTLAVKYGDELLYRLSISASRSGDESSVTVGFYVDKYVYDEWGNCYFDGQHMIMEVIEESVFADGSITFKYEKR